eukprot:TRINITY_DN454_c0_g1_i1.p1 TRINITY_DN454_c0_g1~~TRINITY_DN454_c0_g1_i1.p1  ORF type:complete len:1235 (+),score=638.84 TRINITY_DN454_c0_g1_i1:22-3726(+)
MSDRSSRRLSRLYLEEGSAEGLEKAMQKQAMEEKKKKSKNDITPPPRVGYEDMTKMEDMTLEAVLQNLHDRYDQNQIYTYTASILVAINPFKRLPVYGPGWVKFYKGKRLGLAAPHIYAVAEASYTAMVDHKVNQSVLVSGESGAGKTECTKLILQFLSARTDRQSNIETMVLESVPVLEAFGNAKTGRNDNSSRFGKFIEIQFDNEYFITGSKILPYLLEKSRLISQNPGERNYHIFYQLTQGLDDDERAKYGLKKAMDYVILNQTGCITIDGVDEKEEMAQLKSALRLFEISDEVQENMFKIVASVLHLCNIEYKEEGEGSVPKDAASQECVNGAAAVLGLEPDKLLYAITHKKIKMRSEIIHKPLAPQFAKDQTQSFAKYLYSVLFEWMVNKLNACTHAEVYVNFIGVLDIFGFEMFELNSFEQFLINFANEKLQHFFNHHIFTLEQEEYEREGVDWTAIEFKDNQGCLDLIEKRRPVGILAVLDEECRFPKATDATFIEKLHQNFEKTSEYYSKPRLAKVKFIVNHYAGEVDYDVTGWRDKNKDELPEHLIELIRSSENKYIAILYTPEGDDKPAVVEEEKPGKKKKDTGKQTLGSQFRDQLTSLMTMLGTTEPYFIRCVKPNMQKVPDKFDRELIYNQLLYAGMLETIRIRRMGYPIRYPTEDFWKRFRCICPEVGPSADKATTTANLIKALGLDIPKQCQIGKTKVFLKQEVSNELEDRRNLALTSVILKMQTWWRMASNRAAFVEQSTNAFAIQVWWRMAHRRVRFVKEHKSSVKTQAWWRMVVAMRKRKALLEKKRKEEEERKRKEEEERKKMIEKLGKEEAEKRIKEEEDAKAAAAAKEAQDMRDQASGVQLGDEDEEAARKAEEEAKAAEEEEKKKKKKKKGADLKKDSRGSIMMKKGMELEIPINVDGRVTLGLGWTGGQWDLDASCLLFRYKQHRDDVYYYKPKSKDTAVTHKGGYAGIIRTNIPGEDAEQIEVNLPKVAAKTNAMLFVVTVFSPEGNFSSVRDAYVRLMDTATESEYCRYTLDKAGDETARIMCKLFRHGFSRWRLQAIGAPSEGRLYKHMISKVEPFLEDEPPKRRFKIRIHRGKLVDIKAMYKGEEKGGGLSTMVEVRYDTETKKSKLIKKSNNPQWKTAREIAGHGTQMEFNILNRVRFGHNVGGSASFMKAAHLGYVLYRAASLTVDLPPEKVEIKEEWFKLEQRDKARGRGQTSITGEIKLSIIER